MDAYSHTHTHTHAHTHASTHARTNTHTHTRTRTRTLPHRAPTHPPTHARAHTHTQGYGLTLQEGVAALKCLGVDEEVAAASTWCQSHFIFDQRGDIVGMSCVYVSNTRSRLLLYSFISMSLLALVRASATRGKVARNSLRWTMGCDAHLPSAVLSYLGLGHVHNLARAPLDHKEATLAHPTSLDRGALHPRPHQSRPQP
jgi:hypothetical protein